MLSESEFLKILHSNQSLIHKVCNIYRDTKEDKEDLFQEITYQLWCSYPKFQGKSKITTWMYRIALNTALASFRKKTIKYANVKEFPELATNTNIENTNQEKLFHTIRLLNDSEKAIISLFLEGFNNSEIASVIGISKNNVAVKINRIKDKIKTLIK